MSKFGSARYGGNFVKRNYWKLKDGESVFRILPPMGHLAEDGIWSRFYNTHYGYRNSEDRMRPFQSPLVKNRKTRMVEVQDAALERIESLKAELEKAKIEKNQLKAEKIKELLQTYNLDNKHHVNAMDTQGNIGLLKMCHRAKLALDATIKRLRDQGIDPLSADDGRFFVFRRSGNSLDTTYQVDILMEKLKVEGVGMVERQVVHKLTDDIADRCFKETAPGKFEYKEAVDLDNLYPRPTSEQVTRIVKEGAKAVDEIFDAGRIVPTLNDADNETPEDDMPYHPSPAAQAQMAQAAPQVAQTVIAPVQPQPTVQAAPIPVTTPVATAPIPQTVVMTPPPAQTTAKPVETISNEDFLKSLGL